MFRDVGVKHDRDMTNQTVSRSTLAVSALVAGLFPLVGDSLNPGLNSHGAELLNDLASSRTVAEKVGLILEVTGFLGMLVLTAVLALSVLRRAPVAAAVTAVAGGAAVAVKLASISPLLALHSRPGKVDAAVADLLVFSGDAAFVLFGLLLSVSLMAAGMGLLRAGEHSRWIAWWPICVGAAGVVAALAAVLDPGAYFFAPQLLLLVWMVVLGLVTIVRPPAAVTPQTGPLISDTMPA